jgi:hypothetical protein
MKKIFPIVLAFIFVFFAQFKVRADGLVGGQHSLKHLSDSAYLIIFTGFKGCSSCALPNYVMMKRIRMGNPNQVYMAQIPRVNSLSGLEISNACNSTNTSCSQPPNYNVPGLMSAYFMDTVFLSPGYQWRISIYQGGGRWGLSNAFYQLNAWRMHLLISTQNGYPETLSYPAYPVHDVAKDRLNHISFAADIPTGDSVVYSFYAPYTYDSTQIVYDSGYSAAHFVQSAVPIQLDSTSGMLSFKPTETGYFLTGIKAEQYHKVNGNYVYVGTFYREMAFYIFQTSYHLPQLTMNSSTFSRSGDSLFFCKSNSNTSINLIFQSSDSDIGLSGKSYIKALNTLPGSSTAIFNNTSGLAYFSWQPADSVKNNISRLTFLAGDSSCPFNLIRAHTYYIIFEDKPDSFVLGNDTNLYFTHALFLKLPKAHRYLWSTGDTTQILTLTSMTNFSNPVSGTIFNRGGCSRSDSIRVTFTYTGMEEMQKPECKVFPNPARDIIHIELKNNRAQSSRIELFDANGRMLISKTFYGNKTIIPLDKSRTSGFYMLHIFNEQFSSHQKIIVQ